MNLLLDLSYFIVTVNNCLEPTTKIPNKEVEIEITNHLYSMLYLKQKLNVNKEDIREYINAIINLGESKKNLEGFFKFV